MWGTFRRRPKRDDPEAILPDSHSQRQARKEKESKDNGQCTEPHAYGEDTKLHENPLCSWLQAGLETCVGMRSMPMHKLGRVDVVDKINVVMDPVTRATRPSQMRDHGLHAMRFAC